MCVLTMMGWLGLGAFINMSSSSSVSGGGGRGGAWSPPGGGGRGGAGPSVIHNITFCCKTIYNLCHP